MDFHYTFHWIRYSYFSKIFLHQIMDYYARGYLDSFVSFSYLSIVSLLSPSPPRAPCSFLVALSCTRANLDCFRCSIPLLPSLTFRFSRRFVSIGYFRPGVVVVVAISLGPISRTGETTRHDENVCRCVCVCVCVLNRVEFELILIMSREVVYIFGTDSDGGEVEDGV